MTRPDGTEPARRLRRRHAAERRFRRAVSAAVAVPAAFLLYLLARIAMEGAAGLSLPFLTGTDSTEAARAGIGGALAGSILTIAVTLALAVPVGTLAAIYLEEFAPRNRATALIEVSINNLAGVPSILFGLLGLAVLVGTLGLPRSTPLAAGVTLALMIMPAIVIAGRSAVRGVPPAVRDAALALGASPVQVVLHHVLPRAAPGLLTGIILATARALGEVAPLLLIGMRAFIPGVPHDPGDPAAVLPMQVFLWSDQAAGGFAGKTAAAMLVLVALVAVVNAGAVLLRLRLERRR